MRGISSINVLTMVPLVSFLAALRILSEAQSCNNGLGRLAYEKVSDRKLVPGHGPSNSKLLVESISRSGTPFKVLEECERRCQEDKVTGIGSCASFDFIPGQRRSSPYPKFHTGPHTMPTMTAEYEDSKCNFYAAETATDSELVRSDNTWHFNEVCLSSKRVGAECPNRLYIFERIPGYRLEGLTDKEILNVNNRSLCEDHCLNAPADAPCRALSYDTSNNKCLLHRETRFMTPQGFKHDQSFDYMENMCLNRNQMCLSTPFIVEPNKEMEGMYERDLVAARDFYECSTFCANSLQEKGFLCRSFLFDDAGFTCILYDEDPLFYGEVGQDPRSMNPGNKRPMKSSPGNLYRITCINSDRGTLESDNKSPSPLPQTGINQIPHGPLHAPASSYGFGLPHLPPHHLDHLHPPWHSQHSQQGYFPPGDQSSNINGVSSWNGRHDVLPARGFGIPDQRSPFGFGSGLPSHLPPPSSRHPGYSSFGDGSSFSSTPLGSTSGGHGTSGGLAFSASQSSTNAAPPPLPGSSSSNPMLSSTGQHMLPSLPPGMMPPPPTYGIPYHSGPQYPIGHHQNSIGGQIPYGSSPIPHFNPADRCVTGGSGMSPSLAGYTGVVRFNRMGFGTRLKNMYITKVIRAERQEDCERACVEARDFHCRSFNYRSFFPAENCELSQYDSKQLKMDNPGHFEQHTQFDYYERDALSGTTAGSSAVGSVPGGPVMANNECVEVAQTCTPDGMEFTVKTPDGFHGRIYTYGFYDSCFYDGNGGTINVLRISRANGFPRCGTQQYGDAMTNIVVVQFNDFVQTSRDKKYNLTCYFSGPGEAVVTSNYLDAKTDGRYPTQIEHLPAQNILTSNVVLRVLYRGTPTNTIVVGDLLTFRLEARGQYRYDYYNSDIFATNVMAKDPYTGRQVPLIDSRGCPVDLYVFPELHKTPDGALEAEFYAFKIPDSTFLVFQATVRTCRGPCEPVICNDKGRGHAHFPSWGRRRREIPAVSSSSSDVHSETYDDDSDHRHHEADQISPALLDIEYNVSESVDQAVVTRPPASQMSSTPLIPVQLPQASGRSVDSDENAGNEADVSEEPVVPEEEVHELFRVYMSRSEVPDPGDSTSRSESGSSSAARMTSQEEVPTSSSGRSVSRFDRVCVSQSGYYALVTAITVLTTLVLSMGVAGTIVLKKSHLSKVIQ